MLRENKRMLDRAIRELDRERMGLQNKKKRPLQKLRRWLKKGRWYGLDAAVT